MGVNSADVIILRQWAEELGLRFRGIEYTQAGRSHSSHTTTLGQSIIYLSCHDEKVIHYR